MDSKDWKTILVALNTLHNANGHAAVRGTLPSECSCSIGTLWRKVRSRWARAELRELKARKTAELGVRHDGK